MHFRKLIPLAAVLLLGACQAGNEQQATETPPQAQPVMTIDIQGHRGCRGHLPENTIPAFIRALEMGVTTLEMDVVISADSLVVVSHEPFLSHEICQTPTGELVSEENERGWNLYQLSYAQIARCDCGSRPHPRFPDQEKIPAYKPRLREVIDTVEAYLLAHDLPPVAYNIETKSTPAGDNVFHPEPKPFVDLLMAVLKEKGMMDRCILQSFDPRTLQVAKSDYPDIQLALLVENPRSIQDNLATLGFTPDIYSPDFQLLDSAAVSYLQERGMQVIPWTANSPEEITHLLQLGVDGIISDYPDRVVSQVKGK